MATVTFSGADAICERSNTEVGPAFGQFIKIFKMLRDTQWAYINGEKERRQQMQTSTLRNNNRPRSAMAIKTVGNAIASMCC